MKQGETIKEKVFVIETDLKATNETHRILESDNLTIEANGIDTGISVKSLFISDYEQHYSLVRGCNIISGISLLSFGEVVGSNFVLQGYKIRVRNQTQKVIYDIIKKSNPIVIFSEPSLSEVEHQEHLKALNAIKLNADYVPEVIEEEEEEVEQPVREEVVEEEIPVEEPKYSEEKYKSCITDFISEGFEEYKFGENNRYRLLFLNGLNTRFMNITKSKEGFCEITEDGEIIDFDSHTLNQTEENPNVREYVWTSKASGAEVSFSLEYVNKVLTFDGVQYSVSQ